MASELVRLIPPLAVPVAGASIAQAAASGAVQLFVDRARLLQPDLALDASTVGPVAQICRQLEGLPLALEPLRQYAHALLEECGELGAVQERHTRWCLALAEEEARRFRGPEQKQAFNRLELEHDNLRAALRWAQAGGEVALRLVAALWWFWYLRGYFSEAGRWLDGTLRAAQAVETPLRAAVLIQGERLTERASLFPDRLSPREVEVLALLAQGKSNNQIGQMLTLSVCTVERHIANICLKTGVHGRAEATAYAFQHGLTGKT